ncbi:MAG TPA: biopolymer transporter ExbD [Gammaproteobacteria bacterium]
MRLQTRRDEEPEIGLVSLIDVVLMLVIFFMVTTSFVHEAELKVQLPEASVETPASEAAPLEIVVDQDGDYFLNGRALIASRADVLRRALEKTAGARRDVPLTIRADANTTHQSVVTVMDVAGRMGFVNITIVTANKGGE